MKRDTVVSKVRKAAEKADVSNIDFLAVQINLTDQDPGVFYVEVNSLGEMNYVGHTICPRHPVCH